jgi:hypothetical protein
LHVPLPFRQVSVLEKRLVLFPEVESQCLNCLSFWRIWVSRFKVLRELVLFGETLVGNLSLWDIRRSLERWPTRKQGYGVLR